MGLIDRLRLPWFTHGGEDLQLKAADALERLKGYAEHRFICDHHGWEGGGECTCGLTALLKEIEGHDWH